MVRFVWKSNLAGVLSVHCQALACERVYPGINSVFLVFFVFHLCCDLAVRQLLLGCFDRQLWSCTSTSDLQAAAQVCLSTSQVAFSQTLYTILEIMGIHNILGNKIVPLLP